MSHTKENKKEQNGDMSIGDILASIEVLTSKAKHTWYTSEPPFSGISGYMETIAALAKNAHSLTSNKKAGDSK